MMYGYGYGYGYDNGYDYMGGGMMFMMFIGLIVIVAVVYFVIKASNHQTHGKILEYNNNNSGRAMEILNEKLANGEISEDEYNLKKKLIRDR